MPPIKQDWATLSNINRPARDSMLVEVLITEYCLLITIQSLVDSGYLRFSLESIVLP
jgi:hypothetical protein